MVVPHAGWYFSGQLAFQTMARLRPDSDTIVVIGGHLAPSDTMLMHPETAAETPLGVLKRDDELADWLTATFHPGDDDMPDNTVEVQLPMVRFLFPEAQYVGLRVSPTLFAVDLGKKIASYSDATGRSICVVGSTDLTHYGTAYGYAPRGTGERAVRWVVEENDPAFLGPLTELSYEKALEAANGARAACSAGAAVAAAAFADGKGVKKGTIIGHLTSADRGGDESFVGYGGVSFQK